MRHSQRGVPEWLGIVAVACSVGCGPSTSGESSSGSAAGGSSGGGGLAWHDGLTLANSLTIPAGQTVTIDPGATIHVGAGVTITVAGTLSASSAASHAALTGSGWSGLVVNGTLDLDGVDLSGASAALAVASGGTAEFDDGSIASSAAPFSVASGGALTLQHSTIDAAAGTCAVAGSLTASYLTYTGGGSGFFDGIVTTAPSAQLSIEDSTFSGPGPNGPLHDMLVSSGGAVPRRLQHHLGHALRLPLRRAE